MTGASGSAPVVFPLSQTLRPLRSAAPPDLVDDQAWSRLVTVAGRLPAPLVHRFYLEVRLAADDPQTDLIVAIDRRGGGGLTGTNPAIRLDEHLLAQPMWSALATFHRALEEDRASLAEQVKRSWVELDLHDSEADPLATPRIFVDWVTDPAPRSCADGVRGLFAEVPELGGRVDPIVAERGLADLACMPDSTVLFSVGFFHGAAPGRLRLCVYDTPGALARWLRTIGGAEAESLFLRALACVGEIRVSASMRLMLHLDRDEDGVAGLGVEIGLARLKERELESHAALDHLEAYGLVSPAKRRALGVWPAAEIKTLPHEMWPSVVVRFVNHVKVTVRPGAPPQAKAYLCHGHMPKLRRNSATKSSPGSR